jgi:hypothetical protein
MIEILIVGAAAAIAFVIGIAIATAYFVGLSIGRRKK